MLTAAVGVDARVEADVGALVGGDDAAGRIAQELRRGVALLARGLLLGRGDAAQRLEAVRGIAASAAGSHAAKNRRKYKPGQDRRLGQSGPPKRRASRIADPGRAGLRGCRSAEGVGAAALQRALVGGARAHALEEAREVSELLQAVEHSRRLDREGELDVGGGELVADEPVRVPGPGVEPL